MKDISLLVWISQLGMSLAAPLAGFTLVGVWLNRRYELGAWIIILFCAIGLICGISSVRTVLKQLESRERRSDNSSKQGFNEHR